MIPAARGSSVLRFAIVSFLTFVWVTEAQVRTAATETVSQSAADLALGYIFDRQRGTIHAIQGGPDAAQLGPAIAGIPALSAFVAAPGENYGLGVDAASEAAYFLRLEPSAASEISIRAIDDGADRIILSPAGTAAAFYDRQRKVVQIVRGLPARREVRGPVRLDGLSGLITAIAVNDVGDVLLVAVSEQSGGALYLSGPSRNLRRLTSAARIVSISFLPESNDAVFADYEGNSVVLARDVVDSAGTTTLAGERNGVVRPASLAVSRDGLSVYVTSSRQRRIARVPTAGGPLDFTHCNCPPRPMVVLAGNAVFGLSAAADFPFLIYDGDHESDGRVDPRIVVASTASEAERGQPADSPLLRRRRGRSAR